MKLLLIILSFPIGLVLRGRIFDSLHFISQETTTLFETDTAKIKDKKFSLSVYNTDTSGQYFKVCKQELNKSFKTIFVDSDYTTNNSEVFFRDVNNDGYLDIIWTKKWQNHAYLFNPEIENFIEVGEYNNVDTLKVKGKPILYHNQFPLLYLQNSEKEFEWMTELHSELFIINEDYEKISFATIDNFASLEGEHVEKCSSSKSVIVHCYIPPYFGKFGNTSTWNSGESVDSFTVKESRFNGSFIKNYWIRNYQKLMPYGRIFQVRRNKPLQYFK